MGRLWKPLLISSVVLFACCGSVIFLELSVKQDPGSVNLLTFASFLFVTIEGFFVTSKCGRVRPNVPISAYAYLVILYFIVSVINNMSLSFNISMPLHMIFKGGTLVANILTGMYYFGRRYSFSKYTSVALVSIGIIICTFESGRDISCCSSDVLSNNATHDSMNRAHQNRLIEVTTEWTQWSIGVVMMTVALFMGARMGVFQEEIYQKYGKYPKEALFYTHLLPLPGFLLLKSDIVQHFQMALGSKPLILYLSSSLAVNIYIPSGLAFVLGYVVMQYVCILSVFLLTGEFSSLSVTLVLTLRKFISLIFSVLYFNNQFTRNLTLGAILVFGGTLLFADVPQQVCQQLTRKVAAVRQMLTTKVTKLE